MNNIADLILYNGTLHTLDENLPKAAAAAICGSRILAVGTDNEILRLTGHSTRTIDLKKRLVVPGFWDTHFHFYDWAMNYDSIDFAGALDFSAMETAVQRKARELGPDQWVLGQGFNESDWPENRIPDRKDLDRAAPHNPVCIRRSDCHLAVVNSRALNLAGIDETSADPEGGVIQKDAAGYPTGVLKELAINLILDKIPPLSESKLMDNMKKAQARAHSLGLTGIHDIRPMGGVDGQDALQAWQAFHGRGLLKLRTHVTLPGEMTDQAAALGLCTGFGDDMLKIGHLKFFADGGMGARTAWMTEKYLDAEYGMPLTAVKEMEAAVTKADQTGLSCMVHAIGDRACREVIDMFSRVQKLNQSRCRIPHRMEHIQMILPEALGRLKSLKNLAASCQPNNLSLDINMIDQCVGHRGKYVYAFRSILDTGLPVVLNSDAPVADPNPLAGIYSAVTRKRMNRTPQNGWYPEQCLNVADAVKGYTLTPVSASGCGGDLGSISHGKLADLVVVDQNILEILPEDIADVNVDLTLVNGEIVYESQKSVG